MQGVKKKPTQLHNEKPFVFPFLIPAGSEQPQATLQTYVRLGILEGNAGQHLTAQIIVS